MHPIKLLGIATLLISIAVVTICCSSSDPTPVDTEPDFTGYITDVKSIQKDDVLGTIQVEAAVVTADGEYIDKYVVTLKDDTMILEQDGQIIEHVSFNLLAIEQCVKVWFSGAVKESYPMQVDAKQVMIDRNKSVLEIDLGQETTMPPGQSISIKNEDLQIKFLGVADDSRCPRDATCVWEGEGGRCLCYRG